MRAELRIGGSDFDCYSALGNLRGPGSWRDADGLAYGISGLAPRPGKRDQGRRDAVVLRLWLKSRNTEGILGIPEERNPYELVKLR